MRLVAITEKQTILETQGRLERAMKKGAQDLPRTVGYQGGNAEVDVYWNARVGLWSFFGVAENRYWNAFGLENAADVSSVVFPKLEWLCYEHFAGVCPLEGMCTIPVVSFDVEHDLIDQILF